jgi:hypothetical protein
MWHSQRSLRPQLRDFHEELRRNAGIRATLSRHFLTFNFLSAATDALAGAYTAGPLHRVQQLLAALSAGAYAAMLFLTARHNMQLRAEHMSRRECVCAPVCA